MWYNGKKNYMFEGFRTASEIYAVLVSANECVSTPRFIPFNLNRAKDI